MRVYALLATVLLSSSLAAGATTIASFTAGTFGNSTSYVGQPFTVAGSGNYDDITFNFLSLSTGTPYASGTGYLFSQLFPGEPGVLNYGSQQAIMGFVAKATAANGVYAFDPSVTLAGGTTYYFYEDALIPGGTIEGAAYIPSNLTAQFQYSTGYYTLYTLSPGSNDFQVQGSMARRSLRVCCCWGRGRWEWRGWCGGASGRRGFLDSGGRLRDA